MLKSERSHIKIVTKENIGAIVGHESRMSLSNKVKMNFFKRNQPPRDRILTGLYIYTSN